ncbi:hypothetical protein Pelo_605 [Pelomyxa schiedti]|nr:hypothetical protein Pelo_605 [Pelomyxa schiedti]
MSLKVNVLKEYAKTKGPTLDLSNTDMVKGGGLAIYMRNVEDLNLSGTLFQQGCEEFWNVVTASRVLRTLRLAGAQLIPTAADGLIWLMTASASISSLDISGNPNLGDDAGRKILEGISPRITHLKIDGCGFSLETCCLITDKVHTNRINKGLEPEVHEQYQIISFLKREFGALGIDFNQQREFNAMVQILKAGFQKVKDENNILQARLSACETAQVQLQVSQKKWEEDTTHFQDDIKVLQTHLLGCETAKHNLQAQLQASQKWEEEATHLQSRLLDCETEKNKFLADATHCQVEIRILQSRLSECETAKNNKLQAQFQALLTQREEEITQYQVVQLNLNQKIEELEQRLQQQRKQLQQYENEAQLMPSKELLPGSHECSSPVLPELTAAFKLATQLRSQLKESAPQFVSLVESLNKLSKSLQTATQHNEKLASHLRDIITLKDTLKNQLEETCDSCQKVLGQTLTAQNSEAEIQQCLRNISELTKKVWGIKPVSCVTESTNDALIPSPPKGIENLLKPGVCLPEQCLSNTTTQVEEPFHFLGTLTHTLTQLQGCQFEECTKLADQHTMLSKQLSEQVTLGHNLHKQIEVMQGSCSELMREHKTKWVLKCGLEGNEQFIALPHVWSMLSEVLPQAQQAVIDLIVSKSTSSSNHQRQTPVMPQQTTLPGCTSTSTTSSSASAFQQLSGASSNDVDKCLVCDERPPSVCFQPCGHVVVCSECSGVVKRCTLCRTLIQHKQTLF